MTIYESKIKPDNLVLLTAFIYGNTGMIILYFWTTVTKMCLLNSTLINIFMFNLSLILAKVFKK